MTRKTWRCFHCDEVFQSRKWAEEHFGSDEFSTPACRIGGTMRQLVGVIRKQELELREYRSEDTKLLRAIWGMEADHRQALRREEEAVSDILEEITGARPVWPNPPKPAPENERSGSA